MVWRYKASTCEGTCGTHVACARNGSTEVPRQLWEDKLFFKKAISVLRNQKFDVDSILNAFVKDQSALPSLSGYTTFFFLYHN